MKQYFCEWVEYKTEYSGIPKFCGLNATMIILWGCYACDSHIVEKFFCHAHGSSYKDMNDFERCGKCGIKGKTEYLVRGL